MAKSTETGWFWVFFPHFSFVSHIMLHVNLSPERLQIGLHARWLSHAFHSQWDTTWSAVREQKGLRLLLNHSPGFSIYLFICCLSTEVQQCHLQFSEDMLGKYTAYSSSPTIHLEQMKTSYHLEGACCNPLSTLFLLLPFRALGRLLEWCLPAQERVFTRHLAWSLHDRLIEGKTHTLGGGCSKSSCGSVHP